jgi:hypothetical protein
VLCGARYYDPTTGHWLSRDPIGYAGGQNLYTFCDGNPVNEADPSGTDALFLTGNNGMHGDPTGKFFYNIAMYWAKQYEKRTKKHATVVLVNDADEFVKNFNAQKNIDYFEYIGHGGFQGIPWMSDYALFIGFGGKDLTAADVKRLNPRVLAPGATGKLSACCSANLMKAFGDQLNVPMEGYDFSLDWGVPKTKNPRRWPMEPFGLLDMYDPNPPDLAHVIMNLSNYSGYKY